MNLVEPDTLPPGATNRPGERETLPNGTEVTHRFTEVDGVVSHIVTAGPDDAPTVLVLHGLPETWWAWHNQIGALAASYRVVAVDMQAYGQSDTRLDLDHSPAAMAVRLLGLVDQLGVDRVHLVSHDRGTVLADHLCGVPAAAGRIASYVRMQQSGCEPHSEPRPPHELFADPDQGVKLFAGELADIVETAFRGRLTHHHIADDVLDRLRTEWYRPGVPEAVSAYFRTTNFDLELEQRLGGLFATMLMPVLFLQGALDPGQQPHEYERVTEHVADGTLRFVDAGHFLHLELPDEVNAILLDWLATHPT